MPSCQNGRCDTSSHLQDCAYRRLMCRVWPGVWSMLFCIFTLRPDCAVLIKHTHFVSRVHLDSLNTVLNLKSIECFDDEHSMLVTFVPSSDWSSVRSLSDFDGGLQIIFRDELPRVQQTLPIQFAPSYSTDAHWQRDIFSFVFVLCLELRWRS